MTTTPTRHIPLKKVSVSNKAQDPSAFEQKSTAVTLAELQRSIDERWFKTLTKGKQALTYVPWAVLAKHLHHRCPGWCWEVLDVKEVGGSVVVSGRLSIPTTDGILHYGAVASETLNGSSMAPPVETAASSALRRAAGLAGLGLDLWIN